MRVKRTSMAPDHLSRKRLLSVAVATSLMAAAGCSLAAPIDVGNPDIELRWDNTVKYSAGIRAKSRSDTLTKFVPPPADGSAGPAALNGDDGDRNFRNGSLISNRVDLLSELDLVYRRDFGLRVSAAAWYDAAYNRTNANDSPATNNSLSVPYNEFTDATRKLHGRKAEVLDAFVFGATDVDTARLSGRLGRHTVLWAGSLPTHLGEFDIGVYATRFHAKTPVIYARPGVGGIPGAMIGEYQHVFPEGIRAFGVSATTTVNTVNVAAEVSVRRGTPLTSDPQTVIGPVLADNNDHPLYAIGNSAHANFSLIWTMPRFFLSDEPSLTMEVAYNKLTSCTRNCTPSLAGGNRPRGALDPGVDNQATAVRATFAAPQRNVMDGLDLTPSISVGYNHGISPVVLMGPNNGGDATLTLGGNYLTVWDFSLAYTAYYGKENTATYASSNPLINGNFTFAQTLKDRNFVSLSLRRTF